MARQWHGRPLCKSNSSSPGQSGRRFADVIFRGLFLTVFWYEFHLILFLRVLLTITQQYFGDGLAPNRPDSLAHICGTRGRWFNEGFLYRDRRRFEAFEVKTDCVKLKYCQGPLVSKPPSVTMLRSLLSVVRWCCQPCLNVTVRGISACQSQTSNNDHFQF